MEETGECGEQELNHSDGQAEKFYRDLKQRGICVRVGMEATGYSRWFERLLAELGFEVWIGDPAEIKTKRVKKQKFDREDARLLCRLMLENNRPRHLRHVHGFHRKLHRIRSGKIPRNED
jgi:transposase